MLRTRFHRYPKITLFLVVLAGLALILGSGEAVVRLLAPQINFLDNSTELIVRNVYQDTHAHAKNARALSFGAEVITDQYGFRANSLPPPPSPGSAMLFLGDSVTFGPGVTAEETFVELLAKDFPQMRMLNAAVIGYDYDDYRNFVKNFLVLRKQELGIDYLVLGICLNDISSVSKSNIQARILLQTFDPTAVAEWAYRRFPIINDFLRSRSKLFLLFKSLVFDASSAAFFADYPFYRNPDNVQRALQELAEVITVSRQAQVRLLVVIFPYEFQLRSDNPEYLYPQSVLGKYLVEQGIPTIDLYGSFLEDKRLSNTGSSVYYLFNDPMHFSVVGHATVRSFLSPWLLKTL